MDKELEDFVKYMNDDELYVSSMSISVIIPFYNFWSMTHQRMMELYEHVLTPVEIILVNDCSTDEDIEAKAYWWKSQSRHRVKVIRTPKNLGFGGAHNHGARHGVATGEILVFLSNDVRVSGDFTVDLLKVINNKVLVGGKVLAYDTGWNLLPINEKPRLFPYCMGWFVAATRKVWDDLGGWDDIYAPYDYEDVDISTTAIHKNYDLVSLDSNFLHHDHAGFTIHRTHGTKVREKITQRNQKRFIGKWSRILKDE